MSFKTRAVTGLSFAAVMVGVTLAHAWACIALFGLVALLCLWELSGLFSVADDSPPPYGGIRRVWGLLLGLLPYALVVGAFTPAAVWLHPWATAAALLALFGLFLFELYAKSEKPFERLGQVFLGLIYVGLPLALLALMCLTLTAQERYGNGFVLSILLMIWAGDTGAYMLGSRIGRTKMFPRISPKKTWEGTLSGVVLAVGAGMLCGLLFPSIGWTYWQWAVFGSICAVLGVLGDLVESLLKRSLNIKDSGSILPGHGGFLDRFDSFLFVQPFVFTAFTLMN